MKHLKFFTAGFIAFVAFVALFSYTTISTEATTKCVFTKDLQVGVIDEEVRCLQKYLNESGFVISSSGVGSPGSETNMFGDLTKVALSNWQSKNSISPASGYFGSISRAIYDSRVSAASVIQSTPVQIVQSSPVQSISDQEKEGALKVLKSVLEFIQKTKDEVDDSRLDDDNLDDLEEDLEDAEDDFFEAMVAFFDEDYITVAKLAKRALSTSTDVYEEVGGGFEDRLEKLADKINDARDTLGEEEDDGKDTRKSEEYLDEAEEKLDEAEDAFDDNNFDEAEDLIEDVEDLIDDALDSVEKIDKRDAEDAIEDAQDDIDDAWDDIRDAKSDGKNVTNAEKLLRRAEDRIENAEEEVDDGNYFDAVEIAEDVQDMVEEALDEIN